MLLDVTTFRRRAAYELDQLVDDLSDETRRASPAERTAWRASLPIFAQVLASQSLADFHVHLGRPGDVMVEYRLPASPSWADVVLLGRSEEQPTAVIVELKDWDISRDRPGDREAIVRRAYRDELHPSDQVKGYVEYCRRFHSTVLESSAKVEGCVFFSYASAADAYKEEPHRRLASEYPVFARNQEDVEVRFPRYLADRLVKPDPDFASAFERGVYRQDRGFIRQISLAIRRSAQRPFVLLDQQRRGFELCLAQIERRLAPVKARASRRSKPSKSVVVIEGPPGSGKSAIAAQLWSELADRDSIDGSVVLTATSKAQRTNWETLFQDLVEDRGARGVVIGANSYNPGLNQKWLATSRESGHPTLIADWRDNLRRYVGESNKIKCADDEFAVSIVDEAHALIDPTAEGREGMSASGWMLHAGPQAWHVIRASKVAVFLLDPAQSYRDNETTSVGLLESFAEEFGAAFTRITLEGTQFRCGGSVEYVDWVDRTLGLSPVSDPDRRPAVPDWHRRLGGPYDLQVLNTPFELEAALRRQALPGQTMRLVASYARPWRSRGALRPHQLPEEQRDFAIEVDEGGSKRTWARIWNYTPNEDYSVFIQAPQGSAIAADHLCEIGCPYVVRGFDFDYVGLLWMSDLVWRGDRWAVNLDQVHESAWRLPLGRARKRQASAEAEVIERLQRGYRILLSRALRGTYLWFEDQETRAHVERTLALSNWSQ